jgi:hypothetical protein
MCGTRCLAVLCLLTVQFLAPFCTPGGVGGVDFLPSMSQLVSIIIINITPAQHHKCFFLSGTVLKFSRIASSLTVSCKPFLFSCRQAFDTNCSSGTVSGLAYSEVFALTTPKSTIDRCVFLSASHYCMHACKHLCGKCWLCQHPIHSSTHVYEMTVHTRHFCEFLIGLTPSRKG